jgi:hypothetical protein
MSHHRPTDHIHLRSPSPTIGDAHRKPSPISKSDASKKDVTPKAPPTLVDEWTGFSPRDISCGRKSSSDAPIGENDAEGAVAKAFAQSDPTCYTKLGPPRTDEPRQRVDEHLQQVTPTSTLLSSPTCSLAPPWCLETRRRLPKPHHCGRAHRRPVDDRRHPAQHLPGDGERRKGKPTTERHICLPYPFCQPRHYRVVATAAACLATCTVGTPQRHRRPMSPQCSTWQGMGRGERGSLSTTECRTCLPLPPLTAPPPAAAPVACMVRTT